MESSWKFRPNQEKGDYKARLLKHESNTSIEYGEKTWTTAQTVRDLMQNHLDAETEKYFNSVSRRFVEPEVLRKLKRGELEPDVAEQLQQFLYGAYMYSRHAEDMTPEAKLKSLNYLQDKATNLPLHEGLTDDVFSPDTFTEQIEGIEESIPRVSFKIRDNATGELVGMVAYEALRDEPIYQERINGDWRYVIEEVKIADYGLGYDSQLSSVFVSSKTDKKHTRGKFGEGAKMSELHLLRGDAKIKMRSDYVAKNRDGEEQHRTWQSKARANEEGRLVAHGVEVARSGEAETGSSVTVNFESAKPNFRKEFNENIDPRLDGLGRNIAYYAESKLIYPNAISDEVSTGIDIQGDAKTQYVQGIKVELADEAFGYRAPWFSYDFQDSSIIAGRDRNEIKSSISDKIRSFWTANDRPDLVKELVRVVVQDKNKSGRSVEESFIEDILANKDWSFHEFDEESEFKKERLPKLIEIADEALIEYLQLEPNTPTVIIPPDFEQYSDYRELWRQIQSGGYEIRTVAHNISSGIEGFQKRYANTYEVKTPLDIRSEIAKVRRSLEQEEKREFIEGEKEVKVREVFASAKKSVDDFIESLGLEVRDELSLEFVNPYEKRQHHTRQEAIDVRHNRVIIESGRIWLDSPEHEAELQRKIELHLLSRYGHGSEQMKSSQRFLDNQIERLLSDEVPLVANMPETFDHIKDERLAKRIIEQLSASLEASNFEKRKQNYDLQMRILTRSISLEETQRLCGDRESNGIEYGTLNRLRNQFFVEDGTVTFHSGKDEWEQAILSSESQIDEWQGVPVYKLSEDLIFIPAEMPAGAVIVKGEGKEREYFFNEGEQILHIGKYGTSYAGSGYSEDIRVQQEGMVVKNSFRRSYADLLSEYKYYPQGASEKTHDPLTSGIEVTAIPIEYGKDEWDNPVRVFQDVIQNHIDASPEGVRVELSFEVDRGDNKVWLTGDELTSDDTITAIAFQDKGDGYAPVDIATLGASSKKSPLFAGKYGEGQKMVAAAALRNGIDLQYESNYLDSEGNVNPWKATTTPFMRHITLDGEEVEKKFVAFAVEEREADEDEVQIGSRTLIKLTETATTDQIKQWNEWLRVVDPRLKDSAGNKGLARHVRQIRPQGSENSFSVGSITVLFDEPGAVYENGLRINAEAEGGRKMAFGYDVPEIVTTRERNSYHADRLRRYISHLFTNTKDSEVIKRVLEKVIASSDHVDLNLSGFDSDSAEGYWAETAQREWPEKLVYSSEKLRKDISGDDMIFSREDELNAQRKRREALRIKANLAHFDKKDLVDVPEASYYSLSKMLPDAEEAVNRLERQTVEISPETKAALTRAVVDATNVFKELHERTKDNPKHPFQRSYLRDRLEEWSNYDDLIKKEGVVGLAPVDAGFHGLASEGVILNERLCIDDDKRIIAEVVLHEMNHILADTSDYTEEFVEIMYDLARLLLEKRGGKISSSERKFGRAYDFDTEDESDLHMSDELDMGWSDEDWDLYDSY